MMDDTSTWLAGVRAERRRAWWSGFRIGMVVAVVLVAAGAVAGCYVGTWASDLMMPWEN